MSGILTKKTLLDSIGQEFDPSQWLSVDQGMIDSFADVTRDHQYIHVDPKKAALTPFASTVAHGFLSLSMLSYFAQTGFSVDIKDSKMALNYGFDKVRFISPVKVDSRIRGRASLLSVEEKGGGRLLIKQSVVVEIEDEVKPALLAEWLIMAVF